MNATKQFFPKGADKQQLRPPVALNLVMDFVTSPLYTVRLATSVIGQPFDFQIVRRQTNTVL